MPHSTTDDPRGEAAAAPPTQIAQQINMLYRLRAASNAEYERGFKAALEMLAGSFSAEFTIEDPRFDREGFLAACFAPPGGREALASAHDFLGGRPALRGRSA